MRIGLRHTLAFVLAACTAATGTAGAQSLAKQQLAFDDRDRPDVQIIDRKQGHIVVGPDSLGFGQIGLDCDEPLFVDIRNAGTAPLVVSGISLTGADQAEFSIEQPATPFTLQPGFFIRVPVIFTPATLGAKQASLQIDSQSPTTETVTVPLTGDGVPNNPSALLTATSHDYGDIALEGKGFFTFDLFNTGTGCLAVDSLFISGADADQFRIIRADDLTINGGDSSIFVATFHPTRLGPATATLTMLTSAGTLSIPLTGNALDALPLNPLIDLAFVIDVSGSIDPAEYLLQLEGFASAVENPASIPRDGSVAITVVQFSSTARVEIPLFLINSEADAASLAAAIRGLSRQGLGSQTGPGNGIASAGTEFVISQRPNARQVICMSTDGAPNIVLPNDLEEAISQAQIDGLDQLDVIVIEDSTLSSFYGERTFGGGPGVAFAATFSDFASIVDAKVGDIVTTCRVTIATPTTGDTVSATSVLVTAHFACTSEPVELSCFINGVAATHINDSTFTAEIALDAGLNNIVASVTAVDAQGRVLTGADTISVTQQPAGPNCTVEIVAPADSFQTSADSVLVIGTARFSTPPATFACQINGIQATYVNDSTFSAIIPLVPGANLVRAEAAFVDNQGQFTLCADSITVIQSPAECTIEIITPADGFATAADSILVTGLATFPPNTTQIACQVNGLPATYVGDSLFSVLVPLNIGENLLIAEGAFVDNQGQFASCLDTITVFRAPPPECEVTITEPADGDTTTADSILVTATLELSTVADSIACDINGIPATYTDGSTFSALVPLIEGANQIIATVAFSDTLGQMTTCADTISVVRVPPDPECEITILTPADADTIIADSVKVIARVVFNVPATETAFRINSDTTSVLLPDSTFMATIALVPGDNMIFAEAAFLDARGQFAICADTINVFRRLPPPECDVEIVSPANNDSTFADSILVTATVEFNGSPSELDCRINGLPATYAGADSFMARIPLAPGANSVVASVTFTDAQNQVGTCADTISVTRLLVPPECEVTITAPVDNDSTFADSVLVSALVEFSATPVELAFFINGLPVASSASDSFAATVPLELGDNEIIATVVFTDSLGQTTDCADTVSVFRREIPTAECDVTITSPADNDTTTADSVLVSASVTFTTTPEALTFRINTDTLSATPGDSVFSTTIALAPGNNVIIAEATFIDSFGQQAVCADTINVIRVFPDPECDVTITSPADNDSTFADSVLVTARVEFSTEPADLAFFINGLPVTSSASDSFSALIPLALGDNQIVATVVFTDSVDQTTDCADTISVFRRQLPTPECDVVITSPADNDTTTADSVLVSASVTFTTAPEALTFRINSDTLSAAPGDSLFSSTIALGPGKNVIIAEATFIDSFGQQAVCADTICVVRVFPEPECEVTITSPADNDSTFADSLFVAARVEFSTEPADLAFFINGLPVASSASDSFSAIVPLAIGDNQIIATAVFTDSVGQTTDCADTISVFRRQPPEPDCEVTILAPDDNDSTFASDVFVIARAEFSTDPADVAFFINGLPAAAAAGDSFSAVVPLELGDNRIIATAVFTDVFGQTTDCADTISVFRNQRPDPECTVTILSPADKDTTVADSIGVVATVSFNTPPFDFSFAVNGDTLSTTPGDSVFSTTVALALGVNTIIAEAMFSDSFGVPAVCADTVTVVRVDAPPADSVDCVVTITAPTDSTFICADSIAVTASRTLIGGSPPFTTTWDIEGVTATNSDSVFTAMVPLVPGDNFLVAALTVTDALGASVTCFDTVFVVSDTSAPVCILDGSQKPTYTGEIIDLESGIHSVEIVKLRNRTFEIEPFEPGAKVVRFKTERIVWNERSNFEFKVTNGAGCEIICDPIDLILGPGDEHHFTMPRTDRYLFVANRGLTKITLKLNGKDLNLTAGGREQPEAGATRIPLRGDWAMDIFRMLRDGENQVSVTSEGPAGTSAYLVLADVLLDFNARPIEGSPDMLTEVPAVFTLHQNYPNPFNPQTAIVFDVPSGWEHKTKLQVFDIGGNLVRTLVDDLMAPGQHRVIWDARNDQGQRVSTGMYVYKIVSREVLVVRKMLLTK